MGSKPEALGRACRVQLLLTCSTFLPYASTGTYYRCCESVSHSITSIIVSMVRRGYHTANYRSRAGLLYASTSLSPNSYGVLDIRIQPVAFALVTLRCRTVLR